MDDYKADKAVFRSRQSCHDDTQERPNLVQHVVTESLTNEMIRYDIRGHVNGRQNVNITYIRDWEAFYDALGALGSFTG